MASPLKNKLQIIFLVAACWLLTAPSYAQPTEHVRVAIMKDAASVSIKINGFFQILDAGGKIVLYRGKNLKTTVTAYRGGILMGGRNFNSNKILVSTYGSDVIIINGRLFRGSIQFIKEGSSGLLVTNHIGLEDYIKGIMYHEASHYWPMEALQAQAIVCRTYAIYSCQQNKPKDYDVTSDIYSQVYGGMTSERYRTNQAVEKTHGLILTYRNNVIPAYYHATCAGHTEDASLLWNIDIAPLKGKPCGFCKDAPHFNWHYVVSSGEIKEKLQDAGYLISNIEKIMILGRDKSGRITELKIISGKKDLKVSAKDFRNIIGPNIIKSTNFKVKIIKDDIVFEGFGWGHGVGLCQWGAYFMAKQGYNAKQILQYYYPGTQLTPYEINRF